jgi:hypothetical protein
VVMEKLVESEMTLDGLLKGVGMAKQMMRRVKGELQNTETGLPGKICTS